MSKTESRPVSDPAPELQVPRSRWLVLMAMVFGLFMPMFDVLVVNAALPTIQRELDAKVSDLQWIIDAYRLTFASFILVGGSLGDLFGRKKLFMSGLVIFTLGSLACGLSGSTEQLIAFRAVQGLGAALLLPGSLSILTATFHDRGRGTATGIWAAMSGVAIAAGPLVGGYVVEHYSWETTFFINIPVGILGLLLTAFVVRESRDTTGTRRVDVPGLATGTGGLFLLVYALIEGGAQGWESDLILGAFAGAAILLILFIVIEMKSRNPMLPLHFFRNPTFAASNVVAASVYFALFGTTFFLALYLQDVRGFSPLDAGVRLLPFTAAILLISPTAGRLSDKHGSRWLMTLGCLYAAGGLALLLRIEPNSSYESIILPAFIALGSGMALTIGPMTAAVMGSVDPRYAGVASAATNTTRELGGMLGIALLGALPAGTPDRVSAQAVTAARDSFVEAIHSGLLVAVGLMLLAALVAAIFVRSHVRYGYVEELAVDDYEEDEVRKAKRNAQAVAGEPQIDPRTEQVLREAFEPAVPPSDPEPMPTTEWAPDEPLKPARVERSERRRSAGVSPVRSDDTHYHQEITDTPAAEAEAEEDEPVAWAASGADSYNHLRMLMVDLPIKAGTGEVGQNLEEVALATLSYYQYGLSQPGGDSLPVGVTNGAPSSTQEDIAILAGYMDLEKRFGRVDGSLKTEEAASHLMAALASRALQLGAAGVRGNGAFVREAVDACLQGRRVSPGAAKSSGAADPDRLVYRRGTRRAPGSER